MKTVTTQRIEFIQNIKKGITNRVALLISTFIVSLAIGFFGGVYSVSQSILALPRTVSEHTEQIKSLEGVSSTTNSNVSAILFLQYRTIVAQKNICTTERCVDEYTKLEVDALSTYQNSLKK